MEMWGFVALGTIWASGFGANELPPVTPISASVIDYVALRAPRVSRSAVLMQTRRGEKHVASRRSFPAGNDTFFTSTMQHPEAGRGVDDGGVWELVVRERSLTPLAVQLVG